MKTAAAVGVRTVPHHDLFSGAAAVKDAVAKLFDAIGHTPGRQAVQAEHRGAVLGSETFPAPQLPADAAGVRDDAARAAAHGL